jgi:hypothetical protein
MTIAFCPEKIVLDDQFTHTQGSGLARRGERTHNPRNSKPCTRRLCFVAVSRNRRQVSHLTGGGSRSVTAATPVGLRRAGASPA